MVYVSFSITVGWVKKGFTKILTLLSFITNYIINFLLNPL